MSKDYKTRTNEILLKLYEKYGKDYAISIAYDMLLSNKHKFKKDFLPQVHGEIAETVLEICVIDYIKRTKSNWFFSKGLILKDLDNLTSEYLTEVDFVLFTPYKICAFECKCYKGDKVLSDKCTIKRKGVAPFDLYKQHIKHLEAIDKNLGICKLKNEESTNVAKMCACYFDFSEGSLKDTRDDKWKKRFRYINVNNIENLLNELSKPIGCYDMDMLKKCVNIISKNKDKYTEKHLGYVTNLHKRG